MADEVHKAFIGNLPFDAVISDVETLLEACGFEGEEMKNFDIYLCHDRESGKFKGFGYVTFENESQLKKVIESLDKMEFGNRILKVNQAAARDRGNNGGRHGGGGSGGGGGRGGRHHDGGHHNGGRGGGGGGFRRGGGDRHHNGGGGGRRNRPSQSEDHALTPSEGGDSESTAPPAPAAERPRLNLKPRTTNPAELEARKKKEEEETAARQAKLFG